MFLHFQFIDIHSWSDNLFVPIILQWLLFIFYRPATDVFMKGQASGSYICSRLIISWSILNTRWISIFIHRSWRWTLTIKRNDNGKNKDKSEFLIVSSVVSIVTYFLFVWVSKCCINVKFGGIDSGYRALLVQLTDDSGLRQFFKTRWDKCICLSQHVEARRSPPARLNGRSFFIYIRPSVINDSKKKYIYDWFILFDLFRVLNLCWIVWTIYSRNKDR